MILNLLYVQDLIEMISRSDKTATHIFMESKRLETKRKAIFGPLQPSDKFDAYDGSSELR